MRLSVACMANSHNQCDGQQLTVNVVATLLIDDRKRFRMGGVTDVTYIMPIGKTQAMNSKLVLYGIVPITAIVGDMD